MKRFKKPASLILALIIFLNIFVFPTVLPSPALAIDEPVSSSITEQDLYSTYTSSLFLDPTFSQGLWEINIDGNYAGRGWNFRDKTIAYRDYVTIDPSTLNQWVEVMNGNIDVVRSGVSSATVSGTKGTFTRYRIGHVIAYCGADVKHHPRSDGGKLEVTTAPNPEAIISIPKRTLSLGETMNIALSGTNFITNSDSPSFFKNLTYHFYIDDVLITNGTQSKKFSESVSHTFDKQGTIELKLTVRDGRGKETTAIEYVQVGSGKPAPRTPPTNPTPPTPPPANTNKKPVAVIGAPSEVAVGETIIVENLSYDPDGQIVDANWRINPINHDYNADFSMWSGEVTFFRERTYGIYLEVKDDKGATSSTIAVIKVTEQPNKAPIPVIYGQTEARQGMEIELTDLSFDIDGIITNKDYQLVYKDTGQDVSKDDVTWNFTHERKNGDIVGSTGTFKFHKRNTEQIMYVLHLTVTDNENESASKEHEITVYNDKPVARISAPEEVIQGLELGINSYSYDPDGEIVKTEWEVIGPNDGAVNMEGELNGEENTVIFHTEGEHKVKLRVEDYFGLTAEDEKIINVKPAKPEMDLWVSGTPKENRKVNLEIINVIETGGYPIDWSKTQWEITPVLSSGTTMQDIKIDTDSPIDNRAVLFKKAGKYNVRVRITNGLHWSDWAEQEIEIFPDEEPVADFYIQSSYIRDPENSNKATISPICTSYTTDGDIINQRIWSIRFDSDNDGDFSDEDRIVFSNNNDPNPSIEVDHVGKYLIELEVVEEFNQETIDKFVTSSDRRRDNTDDKDIAEKVTEVINVAPYTNFEVKEKKKVDLIFTVGEAAPAKIENLPGKVENLIKRKLLENNVDAEDIYIETMQTSSISTEESGAAAILGGWRSVQIPQGFSGSLTNIQGGWNMEADKLYANGSYRPARGYINPSSDAYNTKDADIEFKWGIINDATNFSHGEAGFMFRIKDDSNYYVYIMDNHDACGNVLYNYREVLVRL